MERRKHQRVPLAFPIRLRIGDINEFTEEHSLDLGAGGIFVKMNYPPPVGTRVDLEFFLEPVQKLIRARGTVVRAILEGQAADSSPGMGVQFTDVGQDGKRFIELVVQKYNRQHPSGFIDLPEGFLEEIDGVPDFGAAQPPTGTDLEVRLRLPDAARFQKKHAESLKQGRMFIQTDTTRPVGTKVHLHILLEKENQWLTAEGEVIAGEATDGDPGGAGSGVHLKVREPSPEMQRLVEGYEPVSS